MTIKIDADLKEDIQALAKNMGLSVSAIIENKLREVARDRRVVFEEELVLIPNAKFAKQLREIEDDIKQGRNVSGPFKDFEALENHLNSLGHAD